MLATTRLVCSVGLGPNKLCTKIASDLDKPDGLCVLEPERMLEVVGQRPAKLIPGVGPRTAARLESLGIRTVADLAAAGEAVLDRTFGPRLGRELRERARGHDERPVVTARERKSESRETTFADDVSDRARLCATLEELADDVARGLGAPVFFHEPAEGGHAGRTITLKIRLRPFRTHTRSRTIDAHTSDAGVIGTVARQLLADFELDAPVRLLGVGVANLVRVPADREPAATGAAPAGPLTLDV